MVNSSIFVQIASFNDNELKKTIADCMLKSSKKNKIFFGIHECYINEKTKFDSNNVKIIYSKAPENLGVGKARYLANTLYANEDYYLQIDSHSRFIENWDSVLINNLEKHYKAGIKCILSAYPPSYRYDEDGNEILDTEHLPNIIYIKKEDSVVLFKTNKTVIQEGKANDGSYCSESLSAGFIFGKGEISKIPQHPGIFYFGEEFLKAASFYTHGFSLMIPDVSAIFHLYGTDSERIPPWKIFPKECDELEKLSQYIIKNIFEENRINNISLGSERSLKEFGRYIGMNFDEKGDLIESVFA